MNHIETAVAPLKLDAQARAADYAHSLVAKMTDQLAANDFSLDAVAPRPRSTMGRNEYIAAQSRRSMFYAICKSDRRPGQIGSPAETTYVKVDAESCERFVAGAVQDAAASFDAYVAKLCKKVGECDAASICGASLWHGSRLTVTKGEAVEHWHTHQIINVSKLGKVFNQWPTRKGR